MSDLPSREDFADDLAHWNGSAPLEFWSVLDAYASGRLVDREAINYEAAFRYIGGDTPGLVLDDIKAAFAAAIGDTDDPRG